MPETIFGTAFGERWLGSEKALVDLGAGVIRESITWQSVQPAPGQWNWKEFDALMACLSRIKKATGATIILTVRPKSSWAGRKIVDAAPTADLPPLKIAQWFTFLMRIRDRALGIVDIWQIGNEYDWPAMWAGTAADYLAILDAACGVFPANSLALCGWSSTPTEDAAKFSAGLTLDLPRPKMVAFIEKVMESADYDYADFHVYPENPALIPQQAAWVSHRAGDTELLCTEIGWMDIDWSHTEGLQANDLISRIQAIDGWVDYACWFMLKDFTTGLPRNIQRNGLIWPEGTRKKAFDAFKGMNT